VIVVPLFTVKLLDPLAGVRTVSVAASDAQAIASVMGIEPRRLMSVTPMTALAVSARPTRWEVRWPWRWRRPRFPLRLLSQELAVLLDAGIPLLEALLTLREKEADAKVSAPMSAVIEQLEQGQSFSQALRHCDPVFNELFIAVVASSERSGQLALVLREHAAYLSWVEALRSKLIGASIYPALLLLASTAVVAFLLLFVMPRFAGVIDSLGQGLPWGSRVLVGIGQWAGAQPALALSLLLAVVLGPVLLMQLSATRALLVRGLWRLPSIGPRLHTLALAQFYRAMGMLLAAGVPAVQALQVCRELISARLRVALDAVVTDVSRGQRLSVAMQAHGLATPVAQRMVRVGERSGELGRMLSQAASFHDEELSRLSEFISRAVNPVLMLVMGVVIGGIVVMMYLPIFQLAEQVQ